MLLFFLFIIGTCFGSFLSATAWRTKTKFHWPERSQCPHCHKILSAKELIPIFSFIFLHGQCLSCKKPISWQEPTVELISGLLFLTVGLIHPTIDWLLLRDLIFTGFFILLFLVDARTGLLPFKFTLTATIVALIFNSAFSFLLTPLNFPSLPFISFYLGSITCGAFFYLQHLVSRGRWVGGGDTGMGLFLGAALGLWFGIWAIGLAYVIGAIYALFLLATKKATMKSQIPFGPFLAIAGWIILLVTS
ncbi:MAG: prepilin peptidase [Candidatus Uhrbacteria bacterium]